MQDFQKQFILALLAYGSQRNADLEQVCKRSGLSYKAITSDTKTTIDSHKIEQLWKNLSQECNDPLLGLHFGESMQLAALSVVGQIIQTSSTVGEALSNAGALIGLITDMFSMQVEHDKKSFTLHLQADERKKESFPQTFKHMSDYLMVFIVHELDGLLLQRIRPISVRLPYLTHEKHEYARVFRGVVPDRDDLLSIEFPTTFLTQPIISANYKLQNELLKQVGLFLKHPNEESSLQTKIFNYLLTNSYLYMMSLNAVANNFNVSPRTLQRKLKDEGVSFVQIVEEVRQKLAIHYLSAGTHQIKDVAYMLGYNEQSAFIRAFKRWTNKTPTQYLSEGEQGALRSSA